MATHSLNLNIPDTLYSRLKIRAEQAHRTMEAELLEAAAKLVADEDLPVEVAEAIAALAVADDAALWQAARRTLPGPVSDEIEELHLKRQREGLTESEKHQLASPMRQYEVVLSVRAEAVGLLKERDHDVSSLLPKT